MLRCGYFHPSFITLNQLYQISQYEVKIKNVNVYVKFNSILKLHFTFCLHLDQIFNCILFGISSPQTYVIFNIS